MATRIEIRAEVAASAADGRDRPTRERARAAAENMHCRLPLPPLLLCLCACGASAQSIRVTTTIVVPATSSTATWTMTCGDGAEAHSVNGGAPYSGLFQSTATTKCSLELRDTDSYGFEWRGFGKRVVLTNGRSYLLERFHVCHQICCHAPPNSAAGDMVCGCRTPAITNAITADTVAHEPPGSIAECVQTGNQTAAS